jgi:hypothetical protein
MKSPQSNRPSDIGEGSFLAGTLIARARDGGADGTPIEELQQGDAVATIMGEAPTRQVHAVARRRIDHARHPQPGLVTPVRLRAGALGPELPRRDLLLPAEALLLVRDLTTPALVPAGAVVNGTSITRTPQGRALAWYALELDEHDIVLAENLPVATVRGVRADAPGRRQARCARLLLPGAELAALRTRLAAPVAAEPPEAMEEALPDDGRALRLVADGQEVPPATEPVEGEYRFTLPEGTGAVQLVSRARASPAPRDPRRLGVAVTRVELDGVGLALDGPEIGRGFHPSEGDQKMRWRWTDGNGWLVLPHSTSARRLVVTITDWYKNLRG